MLLFNEAIPILDAAKDVNNAGISGALDMRTIPSKRPGYFSATPRSCELRDRNEMKDPIMIYYLPAITMTNANNFSKPMTIPACL